MIALDMVQPSLETLDAARLRAYAFWSAWVGVAFFAVYPALNWITSLREAPLHLYVPAELAVPFVPAMIWAYLSMYVLFLLPPFFLPASHMAALGKQLIAGTLACGAIFLLLPAQLGFAREIPADPTYAGLYGAMFGVDLPHNLVPSLHVVFTVAIGLACAEVARPFARALLIAWLAIVVASTLLVHQHHLLDIASALALVFLLRRLFGAPHA